MKKTLVAAILGIAASATVVAQGYMNLDTFASGAAPYPFITYGGNPVADGQGITVGFYYSYTETTFENATTAGNGLNSEPGLGWTLATGPGSAINPLTDWYDDAGYAGLFSSSIGTYNFGNANPVYMIVVAYDGANYADAANRGHSQAFQITPGANPTDAVQLGQLMQGFAVTSVSVIPEPSTFALAGLGLAGLLIFRRRK